MTISKSDRNQLLVEAKHRCSICAEKCFEIHHIIEQAEGGTDSLDNLIVLCPNCHQHRYHRSKEFTREQLYLYKEKLKEQNEIEKRLLLNLEEIRAEISIVPIEDSELRLTQEILEAQKLVSQEDSPVIHSEIMATSLWLAERELIQVGARKAIEIEWEVQYQREKDDFSISFFIPVLTPLKEPPMRRDWYCEDVLSGKLDVDTVWEDDRVLAFHHPRPGR